jgi:hypothetical protein
MDRSPKSRTAAEGCLSFSTYYVVNGAKVLHRNNRFLGFIFRRPVIYQGFGKTPSQKSLIMLRRLAGV